MTTKFCVVGSPISQSLSPTLHQAAYLHLGLDFSYQAHEVTAGTLAEFLEGSNFQGVSVTMPLKTEAFEIALDSSAQARLTGAANTLCRNAAGWSASNTDVYGLTKALKVVPTPARTAIIGAGATANSALVALAELYPMTNVTVMARDAAAATESAKFGRSLGLQVSSATVSADVLTGSELVLSLVPAGAFEEVWSEISSSRDLRSGWLFDSAYNPWPTLPARSWGGQAVVSGLEMLIWQAIEQVALFAASTGHDMEIDRSEVYSVMKAAVSDK